MKEVFVKNLGLIVTGHTPPRTQPRLYGNHTPFIKATDIDETRKYTYFPEECYSEEGYEKYKKSLIPKGSTCVVTIGSVGKKLTMAHCDCFINQAMNAVIPNSNYDAEYVYYLLKHNIHKLKMLDSGTASGRENISKSSFSNMKLMVIDNKKIQERIGIILSSYDDLIENNQKQIKLLEEAAQRLYKEWFVDLRFPGHENVKIVDGVPEGWIYEPLSEFAYIEMGQSPKSEYYNLNKDGLPFHQGVGSYGNRFVKDDVFSSHVTKIGDAGSILFSVRAPVGRINLTRNRIVIGRGLAAINHKRGKQSFLFYKLKQYFFKEDILGNGSIFASINKNQLMSLEFLVPSDDLINKFDSIVREIDKKIDYVDSQIEHLQEARDRLLPKLMSGEIEV